MTKLPRHLGGHANKTHIDEGTLQYFIKNFDIKTMIDLGCGPGGQVELAKSLGIDAYGIDGDYTLERSFDCIVHDFTKGTVDTPLESFDLCWTVEFVEHVSEEYMANYMPIIAKCKYVVMTHALPGEPGHHHVNCQTADYWVEKMKNCGLFYNDSLTKIIRKTSTMRKKFVGRRGLVFNKL